MAGHRLEVTRQPPETWYKDIGGKEAHFEVQGVLSCTSGELVLGSHRPVQVELLYEDGRPAPEGLLHLLDRVFVGANGQFCARVQITDVSKNHQKQPFCVRFSIPGASGVTTTPVLVLSKPPRKRKRDQDLADQLYTLVSNDQSDTAFSNWVAMVRAGLLELAALAPAGLCASCDAAPHIPTCPLAALLPLPQGSGPQGTAQ